WATPEPLPALVADRVPVGPAAPSTSSASRELAARAPVPTVSVKRPVMPDGAVNGPGSCCPKTVTSRPPATVDVTDGAVRVNTLLGVDEPPWASIGLIGSTPLYAAMPPTSSRVVSDVVLTKVCVAGSDPLTTFQNRPCTMWVNSVSMRINCHPAGGSTR